MVALFKLLLVLLISLLPCIAIAAPSVSRTTGTAPLAVFCDAGTAQSTGGSKPFQHYEYRWTVDASMGNWGTTGYPKNTAYGGEAAFVFETAGTYTITLRVLNSSDNSNVTAAGDGDTFEITVSDPDSTFTGTLTTCINQASDSDFTGCPSGANHVQTDDLSTVTGYFEAGERGLFKRGNSWSVSSAPGFADNDGPVLMGAYGTCTSPDASTGICSNAPAISLADGVEFANLSYSSAGKRDWRFQDITFTQTETSTPNSGAFGGAIDMRQITILRIKATGGNTPIGWSHYNQTSNDLITDMAVVSCDIQSSYGIVLYVGAEKLAVLGNLVADSAQTHAVRVWQAYKSVISNNIFSGCSVDSSSGRHALKLHGPGATYWNGTSDQYPTPYVDEYCTATAGTICLANRTEFAVVSDNVFGSCGPWPVSIGVQDAYYDSNMTDLVIERNLIIRDYGTQSAGSTDVNIGLSFEANLSVLRNNIIDLSNSGSTSSVDGVYVGRRGVYHPDPDYNEVYNNTVYRSDAGSSHIGIEVTSDCDSTIVKNNLISMPNVTETAVSDSGTNSTVSNNSSIDDPSFVDPTNATPLSRSWLLQLGSTAINQGTSAPLLDDNKRLRRYGLTFDLGANEYSAPADGETGYQNPGSGLGGWVIH